MQVGSVVFGPRQTPEEAERNMRLSRELTTSLAQSSVFAGMQPCNCIGPQPGETKCPCMLRAELMKAQEMLEHGVIISGQKYRLVPDNT